tara:strand:+ start:256 stop:534 length:279 start_codon:yes stop_codon:yes gene_type:complete
MKNLEKYISEATLNVREDRAWAKTLLIEVVHEMKGDSAAKRDLGPMATKYVENLQRSNEQLVKLTAIIQKQTNSNTELSAEDKEELYDMIKE